MKWVKYQGSWRGQHVAAVVKHLASVTSISVLTWMFGISLPGLLSSSIKAPIGPQDLKYYHVWVPQPGHIPTFLPKAPPGHFCLIGPTFDITFTLLLGSPSLHPAISFNFLLGTRPVAHTEALPPTMHQFARTKKLH